MVSYKLSNLWISYLNWTSWFIPYFILVIRNETYPPKKPFCLFFFFFLWPSCFQPESQLILCSKTVEHKGSSPCFSIKIVPFSWVPWWPRGPAGHLSFPVTSLLSPTQKGMRPKWPINSSITQQNIPFVLLSMIPTTIYSSVRQRWRSLNQVTPKGSSYCGKFCCSMSTERFLTQTSDVLRTLTDQLGEKHAAQVSNV